MVELSDKTREMIEEFKEQNSSTMFPLDIIIGILAHLTPMICYLWNEEVVQGIFYDYRNHPLFSDWLWYKDGGRYPYSDKLHQVWSSAYICQLHAWVDLRYIMITLKQSKVLARKLNKFTDEHLTVFKEIAERFNNELELE